MKQIALLIFAMILSMPALAADESKERPTQHLKIADVTSLAQAKEIFVDKTAELRSKKKLDPQEAAQIHIITYTLEKSVAYFAENLAGDKQGLAKEMAVAVEDIHIASENNRLEKLKGHLGEYFGLVDNFLFCF